MRSGRGRHHSTWPLVRAAIPAAKSAAAAPSIAPLPPPAISCSAPSARPSPGSRESTSAIPMGSTDFTRWLLPSFFSIFSRIHSISVSVPYLLFFLLYRFLLLFLFFFFFFFSFFILLFFFLF